MNNIPWLLPGAGLSLLLAIAVGPRLAGTLRTGAGPAIFLVAAIGLILAATLTPTQLRLEFGFSGSGVCDLSRFGPPPIREWLSWRDPGLNVLLFIPLGVALAGLPGPGRTLALAAAAAALPIAIEVVQLVVPTLGRGCQSGDVFDNLTGLAIGLVIGAVIRRLARASAGPDRADAANPAAGPGEEDGTGR